MGLSVWGFLMLLDGMKMRRNVAVVALAMIVALVAISATGLVVIVTRLDFIFTF